MEVGFLQETKTILKSLVLSCPNGMTIDRLNRDYKEVVGSWIPYQKLGFSNLELFLKSVPDTLVVTGHGREARIGFVSNDKLQHINEMVSRQKNTTRERRVAVLNGSSQKSRVENVRQSNYNNVTTVQTSPANTYCSFNRKPLINNNLNNTYLYMCPPEAYLYHPNLTPQQVYFSGTCVVDRPRSYNTPHEKPRKNYYVPATKTQLQKKTEPECSKKPDTNKVFYRQDSDKNVPDKKSIPKNVLNDENKLKSALDDPTNSKSIFVESNNSRRMQCQPNTSKGTTHQDDSSKNIMDGRNNQKAALDEIKYPNKDKSLSVETNNSKSELDQQNKSETILDKRNNTQNKTDDPNNSKSVERKNSKGMLGQQKNSGNILNQHNSKNVTDNRTNSKIVSDKQKISKISSNEHVDASRNKSVIKPVKNQIKFSSKKESSEKILERPESPPVLESKNSSFNSNVLKKINTDPFSQMDSIENDIDEAVPEFAANNLVFRVDFPENTVAFGRKIPNYELPKELATGSVVGVFISEIHSPFKFWFHIYKDNHELDILMNRIECFYARLYNSDLVIPKSCLAPGQVCAALFNEMWHRAEILTNVCNNKVKVNFVDYGTVSEIEIQNIKYLPTIFANTPVQAIRGSLSHIKPISPLWPKRAIKEFLSMVSEVLLYAQIIEIDEKEKTVYMVLCDTNSGETVQINKQLVDRGFAKLDIEWDEKKIAKNGYRKRHPREIFPTFEMLETGEYPSLFELEQLLAQGIDYEKITEKIILSKLNNNVSNELLLRDDCPLRENTLSFNLLDTNPFKSDIISEIVSLKLFDD